jgi:hypothetical protein
MRQFLGQNSFKFFLQLANEIFLIYPKNILE